MKVSTNQDEENVDETHSVQRHTPNIPNDTTVKRCVSLAV